MRLGGIIFALVLCFGGTAIAQDSERPSYTEEPVNITDDRLDSALSALDDSDLQTERPEREPEPLPPPRERRERGSNPIAEFFASIFSAIGPLLGWTLVIAIAAAILIALYFMFGESLTLRRKEKAPEPDKDISIAPDLMPDEDAARALLGDAETLAAEGRFAEAVHALLFRSIDLIQERQPSAVKRSLTAREIGQLSGLPALIRSGLSPIIRIVERSYFGGRPVDESGWSEARDAYRSFALKGAAA